MILPLVLAAIVGVPPLPITFQVAVPESTPTADTLYLAGDHPALGGWNPAGVRLERTGPRRYETTVRLAPGTAIEFKVTRGSWATVEKDSAGREIANRRYLVAVVDTVRAVVGAWRDQVEEARPSTRSGDIRSLGRISSRYLAHPREVLVWLPPGYDSNPPRRYPVVYLHDGNNMFDEATSFIGAEWSIDETAGRLSAAGEIEPVILVAVGNSPDRLAEYTPAADPKHAGGRAADYARFLVEELKPKMDAEYRTLPGPETTGTIGSSLGGVVSLYLGYEHPEVFRRIGVVSPSAGWADRAIVSMVEGRAKPPLCIWLDIGTAEGPDRDGDGVADAVLDVRALREALVRAGFTEGRDLFYKEAAGASHNEVAWAARTEAILRALYGRK